MKINWHNIYRERQNEVYRNHLLDKYAELFVRIIECLLKYFPEQQAHQLAEFGCGAGNISRILYEKLRVHANYTLLDNDPKMLKLASESMKMVNNYRILNHDIREKDICIPKQNCIYSHGVLEHFNDRDIKKIISIQQKYSDHLIHYVPSSLYKKPSMGNERLMTPKQWNKICHPDNIIEFNRGYDLILTWGA